MQFRTLRAAASPTALAVDDGDWRGQDLALLRWMAQLLIVRRFEQEVLDLRGRGLVHGPVYSSTGQEAVAFEAALALRPGDRVVGTHGAHHHYLAKVLAALAPEGFVDRQTTVA